LKPLTVMYADWQQECVFIGTALLLFVTSACLTIVWCSSMTAGSDMSMLWLPMCGQTWPGLAVSFLGMWSVMMVAMMLPSLVPVLWRYRAAVRGNNFTHLDWLTVVVGIGYFFVWTVIGMAVFALGAATAAILVQLPALARIMPIAMGIVMLVAGAIQFTRWKARHLACSRATPGDSDVLSPVTTSALRYGLRLGHHCAYCCSNLMIILLVVGMMDLTAMVLLTTAMTAERLAPAGARVERSVGWIVLGAGLYLVAAVN